MTEYRYRLVSRPVYGSETWKLYNDHGRHEINNEWLLYKEYSSLSAARGVKTQLLNKYSYQGEIDWVIQRQPLNNDWETI